MEATDKNNTNEGNAKQKNFSSRWTSSRLRDKKLDAVLKPRWLDDFLRKTFFVPCPAHALPKNELNKYCIDCNLSFCQHCASSGTHHEHQILKIYRHSYKEAVLLASIREHIDCSEIQPYKCNKQLVITLKPLPHFGSERKNEALLCAICSRKLMEPNLYRYCSISCKVEYVLRKPNDSGPSFISIESIHHEKKEESTEPPKRHNKRKGTPHRAPFF